MSKGEIVAEAAEAALILAEGRNPDSEIRINGGESSHITIHAKKDLEPSITQGEKHGNKTKRAR